MVKPAPEGNPRVAIARARRLAGAGHSLRGIANVLAREGRVSRLGRPFFAAQFVRMIGRGPEDDNPTARVVPHVSRRYGCSALKLQGVLLLLALLSTACSRSELDVDLLAGPDGAVADGGDAAPSCESDAGIGPVKRFPAIGQVASSVIDPFDDVYLVIGGMNGDMNLAQSIPSIDLGTGASQALPMSGDTVSLGAILRPVWEPAHDRTIVLGGGVYGYDSMDMVNDTAQVFAVTLVNGGATTALLPNFPEGTTNDIPLPVAADGSGRVFAIADKGSQAGPIDTWVLDATPGRESWSLFDADKSAAVANIELVGMTYDAAGRRLIGLGNPIEQFDQPSMWALSLDAPSGWVGIAGTVPASLFGYLGVLGGGLPLTWDETLCAFVVGALSTSCEYQFWRFDIGSSFTAAPLGVAAQPAVRYGRGVAGYDARRHNFVFGSAFDCDYEQDYIALSTDFVPVLP